METPVVTRKAQHVDHIDPLRVTAAQLVACEQRDQVLEVFLCDLLNLKLAQEQIDQRDCGRIELEPAAEIQRVGHSQLVKEDLGH